MFLVRSQAAPDMLCPALRRMVFTLSRKYDSIKNLPNLPESYDPKIMAGPHLAREGRTTAVELYRARTGPDGVLAHKVQVAGWGDVVVMPRSLLKFVPGQAHQPGTWAPFQTSELALTSEQAGLKIRWRDRFLVAWSGVNHANKTANHSTKTINHAT